MPPEADSAFPIPKGSHFHYKGLENVEKREDKLPITSRTQEKSPWDVLLPPRLIYVSITHTMCVMYIVYIHTCAQHTLLFHVCNEHFTILFRIRASMCVQANTLLNHY